MLGDVDWLYIGKTKKYTKLKKQIADVCRDVTRTGSINEICIHDIIFTFRLYGFEVISTEQLCQLLTLATKQAKKNTKTL